MVRRLRFLLPTLVVGYALPLAVWFALRLAFADRLWPLALVNTAALWLFAPLPLLGATVLLLRRWRLLAVLGVPLALFGVLYGRLLLPAPVALPAAGRPLTVMQLNLLYSNRDTAAIAAAIAAAQPDLVGLQEVTRGRAAWLSETLAAEYPYMAFRVDEPESGVALLSRYPITAVSRFALPPRNLALHAQLDVDGAPLQVVVAHLSPNRAMRLLTPGVPERARAYYPLKAREVNGVLGELRRSTAPQLFLCDCNLTETAEAYALLDATLNDSFAAAGWGLGLTAEGVGMPLLVQRIDYIWHSPGITAESAAVGPSGGSDHRSVVARLRLPAAP